MRDLEIRLTSAKRLYYSFLLFIVFSSSHAQVDFISSNQTDSMARQVIGNVFPEFTFKNTNGDTISHQALKGKITVVNFWFEDCAPCIFELEALNKLISKFKNNPDFQFLSFTVDSPEKTEQAIKKLGITYDVYPITLEDSKRLFCTAYPTNQIIDQQGKIVYVKTGVSPNNIHIQQMELLTAFFLTENNIKSPYSYTISASILPDSIFKPKIIDLVADLFKQLEEKRTAVIGSKYLEFNAKTLQGKTITQDNLPGKITVIDFWEESCHPCMELFDFFNKLYLQYKENSAFQLFTFTSDSKEIAENVVETHNLLFDVACVEKKEITRLNYQTGFPSVLIIDPSGNVSYFKLGLAEKEKKEMEVEIDKLLREFLFDN